MTQRPKFHTSTLASDAVHETTGGTTAGESSAAERDDQQIRFSLQQAGERFKNAFNK